MRIERAPHRKVEFVVEIRLGAKTGRSHVCSELVCRLVVLVIHARAQVRIVEILILVVQP